MRGMSACGLLLGVLLSVGLVAAPGRAEGAGPENEEQKRSIARGYVVTGDESFEQGDLRRALDRYERAERLIPAPTVRLRLARTLARLGKLVEARVKYQEAAKADIASDAPAAYFKAVVEAQKELAALEPKIPTVEIVAPAGAGDATIDNTLVPEDALRAPIPVNPGTHTIELPCCGKQTTSPKEGERLRLTFVASTGEEKAPDAGPNVRFIAGLSTLGVGAVSLGVGIAGTVQVSAANDDPAYVEYRSMLSTNDNVCESARNASGSDPFASAALDACKRGSTGEILQLVFYPLAVVTTGVGIFLLATSHKSGKPGAASRFEVLPTAGKGQSGLLVRGVF